MRTILKVNGSSFLLRNKGVEYDLNLIVGLFDGAVPVTDKTYGDKAWEKDGKDIQVQIISVPNKAVAHLEDQEPAERASSDRSAESEA
jgi:hypothetical protein